MKTKLQLLPFLLLASIFNPACFAQQDSTVKKEKIFKNTVHFNITNPLIFGGNTFIVGYERTLGKHRSISVEAGALTLPKLLSGTGGSYDSIQVNKGSTDKGYHISGEYRFYLKNENKYDAPRGVYLAPYFSYNYFNRKNDWTITNSNSSSTIELNTDFTFTTLGGGVEFGYQFVFWKRLAVDFILLGPGISSYSVKAKLSTSLDADDESELLKKINDALADKIPGYSLVIDDAEFETDGTTNTTTIGFRYMINVGFRF